MVWPSSKGPFVPVLVHHFCIGVVPSYLRCRILRGHPNEPFVPHLFFANDCFLFFKVKESQARIMKDILTMYEVASGQAISLPK